MMFPLIIRKVLQWQSRMLTQVGWVGILAGYVLLGHLIIEAEAQVSPPPITSSGLNTQVSAPVTLLGGAMQHNITGGTRPGGGANLFHSFGEFGVPTNNIANFLNDSGKPTSNILNRVTGGNPSNILGMIQTEGFGNANLFLMNPAGIVFGQNATLNVGGATHFTTADYLQLADGVQFTALPGAQDALLSIAPVAAFGFLGNNPGAISVDGSTLSVSEGQTLSLVGGNVTIGSSALNAPAGNIALVSVASPGEVVADTLVNAPNINGHSFTTMGNISLLEGTTLDVSGDAAGTVIIRGGELMMTNARISADTVNENGVPVAIDIDVTDDVSISAFDGPAVTARTTGTGNAGEIKLSSGGALDVSGSGLFEFFVPIIDTHTSGPGNAGNVTLTSEGDMTITGPDFPLVFLANTGTDGFDTGSGGDVSITAQNFEMVNVLGGISTGNFFSSFLGGEGAGPAGNVTISVDGRIHFSFAQIITDSFDFLSNTGGEAGNVTLTAPEIHLDNNSFISTAGWFRGGNVTINTDTLVLSESDITTQTRTEPGGAVTITGKTIELIGSNIISTTNENANAGDITIAATEGVSLLNLGAPFSDFDKPSSIASNSFSNDEIGILGAPGSIRIATPNLIMDGGSKINSSSGSSGNGGPVIINAETISISGQTGRLNFGDLRNFGQFQSSGIFTGSLGGSCAGPCGAAGNLSITTNSIVLEKGAQINSGTTTEGNGGSINVNSSGNISISGTLKDGTPGGVLSQTTGTDPGSGAGGTISLIADQNFTLSDGATVSASSSGPGSAGAIGITAGALTISQGGEVDSGTTSTGAGGAISLIAGQNFTLSDGATVSTSSEGPGNAGDVTVTAGDTILIDKGTVTTEAARASGGNIKLTASDTIQLVDSTIASSVEGDVTTQGGNINLDPDFITLQNSRILAKAVEGQGGNISLVANDVVLVDSFSEINATASEGISGSVNIQAPVQFLSGTIAPLPQNPAPVTALYGTRCVAGEGGHFSTFVDSKSDSLAPQPGTFLASPFLPLSSVSHAGSVNHTETSSAIPEKVHATPLQLAAYSPPVLFSQNDDVSSACP